MLNLICDALEADRVLVNSVIYREELLASSVVPVCEKPYV